MNWHLINDGEHTGHYNMQTDINLANNCKTEEAFLRFYRWQPYCISIGTHQQFEDINLKAARKDNLDVVKRPTGGRAILHSEELTYSVILSNSIKLSNEEIFNKISLALIKGLVIFNKIFESIELAELNPNFRNHYKDISGVLCFSSTAKHEVKFNKKKLIGSAQRRLKSSLLQHGSILVGNHHLKIINYLNIDEQRKQVLYNEILQKTTEIDSITNSSTNYSELIQALIKGFIEIWRIEKLNY